MSPDPSLFETPAEVAEWAVTNKVDIVGVSSLAAGHKTLVPELIEGLKSRNAEHIKVVCGGVIPEQDYAFLKDASVADILGPSTNLLEVANAVLDVVLGLGRNR